ncbi:MAG: putative oxidoreductase C-terminal domain-containing protein [Chitinophagaceae bacterium]
MKQIISFAIIVVSTILLSCNNEPEKAKTETTKPVQLVTLDPGHFHAALVQKSMYDDVDSVVYVYAPAGSDLQLHLDRINSYNSRADQPTHWKEEVYIGNDFFEKMIAEKKGNVVVLSGNNQKKDEYILKSLENGFNVLADKPMVIESNGFEKIKEAFDVAAKNKLLLYDIMTERYEINTILQREFSMIPEIFGTLEKGTADNPAISMISVHYLYKYVSGSVLTRPAWFLDVSQQGEGVTDVMTHLVDLVQWECFPDQTIDYTKDIQVNTAKRWTTDLGLSQFKEITKQDSFPSYLKKDIINDTLLKAYFNGELNYQLRGVHAKTIVKWNYKAPEGAGDTHYSIMRGTKANLIIRQGAEEKNLTTLYIEPVGNDAAYEKVLQEKVKAVFAKYNGGELYKTNKGWKVILPEKLREGHEAHFARVTQRFLEYMKNGNIPSWEVPNMIAKYYTTTKGLELALNKK